MVASFAALEPEPQHRLQGPGIAFEAGDQNAVPPRALGPEIDKRDRTPEQIRMRDRQLLVIGITPRGLEVEGAGVGMAHADVHRRAQFGCPPVLVPDPTGICGDRRARNR